MLRVIVLSMFVGFSTFASGDSVTNSSGNSQVVANAQVVAMVLSSKEVQNELKSRSIIDIKVSQQNVATTWTYTLIIRSSEVGWAPNGPSSHPCSTKVTLDIVGGVAGNSVGNPKVQTICAMNSPRF